MYFIKQEIFNEDFSTLTEDRVLRQSRPIQRLIYSLCISNLQLSYIRFTFQKTLVEE